VPVTKPFRRTCRQFVDGSYAEGGRSKYIRHPKFAKAPQQYIRAFMLIQKDLQELFDYVEPSYTNHACYSYRIHELLTRTCIEIEANCKAILSENGYARAGNWDMGDYRKLNATHHLSSYEINFPLWHGSEATRTPFAAWSGTGPLKWYQAYNETKHDRHEEFEQANFENLLNAVAGLTAILSSQFYTDDFAPQAWLVTEGPGDAFESAIGGYFRVKFPDDWPHADKYEFNWQILEKEADPFHILTF
jgi:hypothetical protein